MNAVGADGIVAVPRSAAESFQRTVWERAVSTCVHGSTTRFVQLGGRCFRIRSASLRLLSAVTDALAAIASFDSRVDLDVILWETTSGSGQFPELPRNEGDQMQHGRIESLSDSQRDVIWQPHFQAVTCIDVSARRAVYAVKSVDHIPYEERAAPLKPLWNSFFLRCDHGHVVHGAAIARGNSGLFLTAPGGSGKSTTALTALKAGWDYLGDDWCLITGGERIAVHHLYSTAKLHWDNLHRVGEMADWVVNRSKASRQKAVLDLNVSGLTSRFRPTAELGAIVVPSLGQGPESTVARIPGAAAFHAMVIETVRSIPGAGRKSFDLLAELCRRVPVYSLRLGHDLAQIPVRLESIIANLS